MRDTENTCSNKECEHVWRERYAEACPKCGEEFFRRLTIVTCCGQELECPNFTNTCRVCGRDYNWAGQELAPRSQWGFETNEALSDIMSVDGVDPEKLLESDY